VEQLGAGSRPERIEASPKPIFKFVRSHVLRLRRRTDDWSSQPSALPLRCLEWRPANVRGLGLISPDERGNDVHALLVWLCGLPSEPPQIEGVVDHRDESRVAFFLR